MSWNSGVYTRGYASWSVDAAANLPISATKFDTEDNDFATGLNLCLTKDGLNKPNAAMTWGLAAAQVLALTRGNDGILFSVARTGGSNNPALTFSLLDATGAVVNISSGLSIDLQVLGTSALKVQSNRSVLIGAPNTGATASLIVQGVANSPTLAVNAPNTSGQSLGLRVAAGTTAADYAFLVVNGSAGAQFFEIRGDGATGFFGAAPIAQPTVTGSRGGNAALLSLVQQLALLGLIVNGTS